MINQENLNPDKSVKQKTPEELKADIAAMHQQELKKQLAAERGRAAQVELAKRLGTELNRKAGLDLYVERKAQDAIHKATRKQYDPASDVILVAVFLDNDHAQNVSQRLDEETTLSLVNKSLEEHLPGGAKVSAISLKGMQKHNMKLFSDAFSRFKMAVSYHNKTQATVIQRDYKYPFSFRPGEYLPGE